MKDCDVSVCSKRATTRIWCNTHYCQVIRKGRITNTRPVQRNVFKDSSKLEELIKSYRNGKTVDEISRDTGVHKATVYYNLHRHGVKVRTKSESKMAEKNPMWAGDKVKYGQLHNWVKKRLPKPKICPICKERNVLDLANIAPKPNVRTYNRNLENWEWLCRRCHMVKDGRLKRLNQKTVC